MKLVELVLISFLICLLATGCSTTESTSSRCIASDGNTCADRFKSLGLISFPIYSTMGFEIEGSMPKHLDYRVLAGKVKSYLMDNYQPTSVKVFPNQVRWGEDNWRIEMLLNGKNYVFNIMSDVSLNLEDTPLRKGIEVTSPILTSEFDISVFYSVVETLKYFAMDTQIDVGGNHVHYGLPDDITYEKLLEIYEFYDLYAQDLIDFFRVFPDRNPRISRLSDAIVAIRNQIASRPNSIVRDNPIPEIMLRTLIRYVLELDTLETRLFPSATNPSLNSMFMKFASQLTTEWLKGNKVFDGEKRSIEEVLKLIGFSDLEVTQLSQGIESNIQQSSSRSRSGNRIDPSSLEFSMSAYINNFWEEHKQGNSRLTELFQGRLAELEPTKSEDFIGHLLSHYEYKRLPAGERSELLTLLEKASIKQQWVADLIRSRKIIESSNPIDEIRQLIEELQTYNDFLRFNQVFLWMPSLFKEKPSEILEFKNSLPLDRQETFLAALFSNQLKSLQSPYSLALETLAIDTLKNSKNEALSTLAFDILNAIRIRMQKFNYSFQRIETTFRETLGTQPHLAWVYLNFLVDLNGNVEDGDLFVKMAIKHFQSEPEQLVDFRFGYLLANSASSFSKSFIDEFLIPFLQRIPNRIQNDPQKKDQLNSAIEKLKKRISHPELDKL